MSNIKVNVKEVLGTVSAEQIEALNPAATEAMEKLHKGTGAGSDFLGWVNLPEETSSALLADIEATAKQLRETCDYVVSIGIGGSYLGAKAVIEALSDSFASLRGMEDDRRCRVLFAGQNIGEDYLHELQDFLADKKFGIIVISKSGNCDGKKAYRCENREATTYIVCNDKSLVTLFSCELTECTTFFVGYGHNTF